MTNTEVTPGVEPLDKAVELPKSEGVPDLKAVLDQSRTERRARLEKLGGIEADSAIEAEPPVEAPARDLAKEFESMDPELRNFGFQRFSEEYNEAIRNTAGDLLPLVSQGLNNPKLRRQLASLAQDEEFLSVFQDEDATKFMREFGKKKDFLGFAREYAVPVYEEHAKTLPQRNADAERADALQRQLDEQKMELGHSAYIQQRKRDLAAFTNSYQEFKEPAKLKSFLDKAEDAFYQRARLSGIDVNNPYWSAQAIEQGIRPPTYAEFFEQTEGRYRVAQPKAAPSDAPGAQQPTRHVAAPKEARSSPTPGQRRTKQEELDRGAQAIENFLKSKRIGKA